MEVSNAVTSTRSKVRKIWRSFVYDRVLSQPQVARDRMSDRWRSSQISVATQAVAHARAEDERLRAPERMPLSNHWLFVRR